VRHRDRLTYTVVLVLACVLWAPPPLSADTLSPDIRACEGLKAGDRCELPTPDEGKCVERICTGKYGDPDAPCLECQEASSGNKAKASADVKAAGCQAALPLPFVVASLALLYALRRRRRT
jgi:hypothetical protein